MSYQSLRPLLFRLDPEQAHHLTLNLLRLAGNFPVTYHLLEGFFEFSDPRLRVNAFGLEFKNPVGLAAGYDKDGLAVRGLSALGFGHVEVGTVTRCPQAGNPRPRIHRLPEVNALINSMGFPNSGVDALLKRSLPRGATRVGINIGKSKETPLERAPEDYTFLLKQVHASADYIALNVSSPNTPELRQLQLRAAIEELVAAVTTMRDSLQPRVPLLLKIAPDLSESEIDTILAAVLNSGIDGIIATNTTSSREGLAAARASLPGGLSGAPLRRRSTQVIRYLAQRTEGRLPIVGVGGIANVEDALDKLCAGAWLVQIYTGLVYAGPRLVHEINVGLARACEQKGVQSIRELTHKAISRIGV